MDNFINWLLVIFSLLIVGCNNTSTISEYENGAYLCKGSTHSLAVTGSVADLDDEIAMRVTDDRVFFSGSSMLQGDNIKICPIGSIEFAKKDEMYFDSSGCSMDDKALKRQYGTYNYITKKLNLSNEFDNGLVGYIQGSFHCSESK